MLLAVATPCGVAADVYGRRHLHSHRPVRSLLSLLLLARAPCVRSGVIKLLFLVVKMFFVAHLLACGWFYVASSQTMTDEPMPGDGSSWIADYDGGSALYGPIGRQYLFSLYWAFTTLTTVGYGDITASSDLERQYCTGALLVGAFVFAYILGDISSLLATLDRQAAMVEEKIDAVKEYLQWRGIPREVAMRVKR